MPYEVMTIKEVAALLEFTEKTAYATPLAGEISAFESHGRSPIRSTEFELEVGAPPRGGDGGATWLFLTTRDQDSHEERNRCR
ncbi:MAG: hypothetical protein L6R30_05315 [Thermoanaerobaculia bacterium]|nr:hypothetical protein [Thermoanaerobaculia bacterium]